MSGRINQCRMAVCIVSAMGMLLHTGAARAQFDSINDIEVFDNRTVDAYFAVSPNTVPNWSVDSGCSPGIVIKGRGDNNGWALQSLLPPSTGTRLVKDLNPGPGSSVIGALNHCGIDTIYHLFLSADNGLGATGQELYSVMSGLYPIMTMKKDINPGPAGSNPTGLYHHAPGGYGKVFFSADDGVAGRELWYSNTSANLLANESTIKDINPGPGSSSPAGFALGGYSTIRLVVFSADDGTNGRELWMTTSDPNLPAQAATLIKDINPIAGVSSDPQQLTTLISSWAVPYDVKVFFTADDGVNGRELWRTDGTTAGTVLLKDIEPGPGSSNPTNLTAAGILGGTFKPALLYFTVGNSLWSSQGGITELDTTLIKDVGGNPANLTVVFNAVATSGYTLYFTVGNSLWKSNGTVDGTVLVKTFLSAPANLTDGKGTLYFAADDGDGVELWKSNSTGISQVKDIRDGTGGSMPTNMSAIGSNVCFTADDGVNGRELWRTDGTDAGTVLVKDINPGPASSNPVGTFRFESAKSLLFFTADDGVHGRELWESDGYTEASQNHMGYSYKWELESLIKSKGDASKVAVAATDGNVLSVYCVYDFPALGGLTASALGVPDGLSEAAHEVNHYVELTDGIDRAPLDITYVDCGDGNVPRPRAALTDGKFHNAIAFGMIAVLDQNPCDADPRSLASPGVPFANVPAVYDGHDWIPVDRLHFTPGVPSDPPTSMNLAQAKTDNTRPARDASLPSNLVEATTDPMQTTRYGYVRIDVLTDYIRVLWNSKQNGLTWVATLPRHYKGGFKALHTGNKAGMQPVYPYYFDSLSLNGGLFATSPDMYGACCTQTGCADVVGQGACSGGTFASWKTCADPTTPRCCPVPWADADWDGDVDTDDFATLQQCITSGDDDAIPLDCACFDRNGDEAIDLTDVNKFVTCGTGPNVPPTPPQITDCDTYP